ANAGQRADQFQAKIDALDKEIEAAPRTSWDVLYAHRYELTAELNLAATQRNILQEYAQFLSAAQGSGSAALTQKIDELERSVPEILPPSNRLATTMPSAQVATAQPF